MKHSALSIVLAAIAVSLSLWETAAADEHARAAAGFAQQAAEAKDSQSVIENSAEALKHLEAAKASAKKDPAVMLHLKQGEAELKAADQNARFHNTETAVEHAAEGQKHLDAATK